MPDPYQKYGGKVADDPYAKYNQSQPFTTTGTPSLGTAAPSLMDEAKEGIKNLGIGALKGVGHTLNEVGSYIYPDALAKHLTGVPTQEQKDKYFKPSTPAQSVGYGGEQVAEFLTPTGLESGAAKLFPKGAPIARIGGAALDAGLKNKMQGGDFSTGAEVGAIGGAAGEGLKFAAPKIAEAAAAPGKRLLKSVPEGVDIGKTILNESTGYKPATIARELGDKVAEHGQAVTDAAQAAKQSGARVPLGPARTIAGDEAVSAIAKNSPSYLRDVTKVNQQLTRQIIPGNATLPLPSSVDPVKARALKQGIDLEIGSWNPEAQSAIDPLKERVYGALNAGFHAAVPEAVAHDAAMTQLIPAQKAMSNTAFNPGITRSVLERFARPTGALVGAGLGMNEGYKEGGVPGAIAGGVGGLVIPNMITSPTGMMMTARFLDKGLPAVKAPALLPLLGKRKSDEEEEQNKR